MLCCIKVNKIGLGEGGASGNFLILLLYINESMADVSACLLSSNHISDYILFAKKLQKYFYI